MTKLTYKGLEGEFTEATVYTKSKDNYTTLFALKVRIFATQPTENTYFIEKNDSEIEHFPFTEKGLREAIRAFNSESK